MAGTKRKQLRQEDLAYLLSAVGTSIVITHRFLSDNDLLLRPSQSLSLQSSLQSSALSLSKLLSLLAPSPRLSLPPPPFSPDLPWFSRLCSSLPHSAHLWPPNFVLPHSTFSLLLQTLLPSLSNPTSELPLSHPNVTTSPSSLDQPTNPISPPSLSTPTNPISPSSPSLPTNPNPIPASSLCVSTSPSHTDRPNPTFPPSLSTPTHPSSPNSLSTPANPTTSALSSSHPTNCTSPHSLSNPMDPQPTKPPSPHSLSDPTNPTLSQPTNPTSTHSLSDHKDPSFSPPHPASQHFSPETALAAALHRLAHATPFAALGPLFGLEPPEAASAFFSVLKATCTHLSHLFHLPDPIAFPPPPNLPNCRGALIYARFPIAQNAPKPFREPNGQASVLVQAVVGFDGTFADISAGWPGRLKPSSILARTALFSRGHGLLQGPKVRLANGFEVGEYLVGGPGCPLLPWLVTPYGSGSTQVDSSGFDAAHGRAMGVARRAIARLWRFWGLLSERHRVEYLEYLPYVVAGVCLLMNFMVRCGEGWEEREEECRERERERERGDVLELEGGRDEGGERIRDALAHHIALLNQPPHQ